MLHGPTPAGTAVRRSQDLLAQFPGRPRFELVITTPMCVSLAMLGRFQEAHDVAARAMAIAGDLGSTWNFALAAWMAGEVQRFTGDWQAAEHKYRTGYEILDRMGEKGQLTTLAVLLGNAVYAQGRHDEAFDLTKVSSDAASAEDSMSQMLWRPQRRYRLCGLPRNATGQGYRAANCKYL